MEEQKGYASEELSSKEDGLLEVMIEIEKLIDSRDKHSEVLEKLMEILQKLENLVTDLKLKLKKGFQILLIGINLIIKLKNENNLLWRSIYR